MLKEKIVYKDELPINVVTANITEYPIHFHDDMEVVYVLDGSVILRNGYYTYTLKQGDVFILNDREMHSFQRSTVHLCLGLCYIRINSLRCSLCSFRKTASGYDAFYFGIAPAMSVMPVVMMIMPVSSMTSVTAAAVSMSMMRFPAYAMLCSFIYFFIYLIRVTAQISSSFQQHIPADTVAAVKIQYFHLRLNTFFLKICYLLIYIEWQ